MSPHRICHRHIIRMEEYYQTTVICMPGVTFYIDPRGLSKLKGNEFPFEHHVLLKYNTTYRIRDDELQYTHFGEYDSQVTSKVLKDNLAEAEGLARIDELEREASDND